MTPQQISTDIIRGIQLRNQIKAYQTELKAVEKRLEQAGLEGEQIPLQEADREGRQFLARSPQANLIVPVVFESDQIVASYRLGSDMDKAVDQFVVEHNVNLGEFYQPVTSFVRIPKDGQAFRKTARAQLGTLAPEFLSRCLQRDKDGIPRSRTIIAWDNAKPIDQVTA
jgi:hypothetical protein